MPDRTLDAVPSISDKVPLDNVFVIVHPRAHAAQGCGLITAEDFDKAAETPETLLTGDDGERRVQDRCREVGVLPQRVQSFKRRPDGMHAVIAAGGKPFASRVCVANEGGLGGI